jgi:formylglycine-generating enzyme required for sulfatase activity
VEVVARIDGFTERTIVRGRKEDEANRCLDRARAALMRYRELGRRRVEEQRVVAVLKGNVPGYSPLSDKRPIWEAEDRVRELAVRQLDAMTDALAVLAGADLLASDAAPVQELSAELWWDRLADVETGGDPVEIAHASDRLSTFARPGPERASRFAALIRAPGDVSLIVDAAGATLDVARLVAHEGRWLPETHGQHPAPLDKLPLEPGGWLLTIRAPGRRPVAYPLWLGRLQQHRDSVRMYTAAQVGDEWCFVPAGAFKMGGDPGARNPLPACAPHLGDRFVLRTCVRSIDYRAFLETCPTDEADYRCPGEKGMFGARSQYWSRGPDGHWNFPEGWDPDWPVMGVSLDDAAAYARWLSVREGRPVRVPTELEWEKASRGVDGRPWPWGDRFDPTYCHMRESQPGTTRPSAVGMYPVDTSVYGVMDTAGGMREWTTSTYRHGQMVVRGGTWGDDADDCRCASRAGLQPTWRMPWVSFRLVTEVPRPV